PRRRNDAPALRALWAGRSGAPGLGHVAAPHLYPARVAAAAARARLLADHADDHLGLHVDLPRHQFELGGQGWRGPARGRAAMGRGVPGTAGPVALFHGGDVVAQSGPPLRQPLAAWRTGGLDDGDEPVAHADRRRARGAALYLLLSLLGLQPWPAAHRV